MIGNIRKTRTPFYSAATGKKEFKYRPALIIAEADSTDYVVLPVSTISRKENRNPIYDIEIDPENYPKLNLDRLSYVRTHKQTIIYRADIGGLISDLKSTYPDLYETILKKREDFSRETSRQARL